MPSESNAHESVAPQAELEANECVDGVRCLIKRGYGPEDAVSFLASAAGDNYEWLTRQANSQSAELKRWKRRIEVFNSLRDELGNTQDVDSTNIGAQFVHQWAGEIAVHGIKKLDEESIEKSQLLASSDCCGDILVRVEGNLPLKYSRKPVVPRITGRNWVERAIFGRGGWPYLMGKDPVTGGTVLATFSYCRFIPTEMIEFYGVVMPENSEQKLLDMLARGKVPGMKMFEDLDKPEDIGIRYRNYLYQCLGDQAKQISRCHYDSTCDRLELSVKIAQESHWDDKRLNAWKVATVNGSQITETYFGFAFGGPKHGEPTTEVCEASRAFVVNNWINPPVFVGVTAPGSVEATLVLYCPFWAWTRQRQIQKVGKFLEMIIALREEIDEAYPCSGGPVVSEPEARPPTKRRGRPPKPKPGANTESFPGLV